MVVSPEAFTERPKILVIDDDQRWRETVRELLDPRGYETLEAESGEQAIEVTQNRQPHLLILDIHMPRLDGIETLRIIREESCDEVPTIMVSSQVSDDVIAAALALHAFTVMSKMVNMHRLLRAVAQVLERYYSL